jgi:hypothetical protein
MEPALCPRVRTRGCASTVLISILGRSAVHRRITRVGNQLSYTVQEIIFSNTPSYGVSGSSLGSCQERVVYAVTQRRLGPFFTLTPYICAAGPPSSCADVFQQQLPVSFPTRRSVPGPWWRCVVDTAQVDSLLGQHSDVLLLDVNSRLCETFPIGDLPTCCLPCPRENYFYPDRTSLSFFMWWT